jgi:hypothetical protein
LREPCEKLFETLGGGLWKKCEKPVEPAGQASQVAEIVANFVILSEAKNLSFFFMGSNRGEIPRFAGNDKVGDAARAACRAFEFSLDQNPTG